MNVQSNLMIPKMDRIKHIHFIGIGGTGMSGIAEILLNEGYQITGSDLVPSLITKRLILLGIKIYFKHCPENIYGANVIVISNAISLNNPEIVAAHNSNIPVIYRAEMLAEIMRFRYGIVVAGTHGKTTTTAIISDIYIEAGLDPTFINGGLVKTYSLYTKLGISRYLITEADESDASLLNLKPILIIITNIDNDHVSNYNNDFQKLKQTFIRFLHNLPFYGRAIICIDDLRIRELLPYIKCQITTYGFSKDADVQIKDYKQNQFESNFSVIFRQKKSLYIKLNMPGQHNALNATAAIAVAIENDINDKVIINSLKNFQGISRRFDYIGEFSFENVNGKSNTFMLIDDYGHHPTEIYATIKTVRDSWPEKKIIMLFQPHRFTRTRDLYEEFVDVLSMVDILLMLNIYSAGEKPLDGINSFSLCNTIRNKKRINPILISNFKQIIKILTSVLTGNDLVLIQGAGSISKIINFLVKKFKYKI